MAAERDLPSLVVSVEVARKWPRRVLLHESLVAAGSVPTPRLAVELPTTDEATISGRGATVDAERFAAATAGSTISSADKDDAPSPIVDVTRPHCDRRSTPDGCEAPL